MFKLLRPSRQAPAKNQPRLSAFSQARHLTNSLDIPVCAHTRRPLVWSAAGRCSEAASRNCRGPFQASVIEVEVAGVEPGVETPWAPPGVGSQTRAGSHSRTARRSTRPGRLKALAVAWASADCGQARRRAESRGPRRTRSGGRRHRVRTPWTRISGRRKAARARRRVRSEGRGIQPRVVAGCRWLTNGEFHQPGGESGARQARPGGQHGPPFPR